MKTFINKPIRIIILLAIPVIFSMKSVYAESQKEIINLEGSWKFTIGDNPDWSNPNYDDKDWENISVPNSWEVNGFEDYNGFAWYRKSFSIKEKLNEEFVYLYLGRIDDADEVYLNGKLIGSLGIMPPNPTTAYNIERKYAIPVNLLNINSINHIAIRVYDYYNEGGIIGGPVGLYNDSESQLLEVDLKGYWFFETEDEMQLRLQNKVVAIENKIFVPGYWESNGYQNYDGKARYKTEFRLPANLETQDLILVLGLIDDMEIVKLNGVKIGSVQTLKKELKYYKAYHEILRGYVIPKDALNINGNNVLTVMVYDDGGLGGIYSGPIGIATKDNFEILKRTLTKKKACWKDLLIQLSTRINRMINIKLMEQNLKYIRFIVLTIICLSFTLIAPANNQNLKAVTDLSGDWKFSIGDNVAWSSKDFNDENWETINVPQAWESQGFNGYNGYAWYRTQFTNKDIPVDLPLFISLGYIDDVDEVFVNGKLIGKTGSFPFNYSTAYNAKRLYRIPNELINKNGKNTIAVRVYDEGGEGGIIYGDISLMTDFDAIPVDMDLQGTWNFKINDCDISNYRNFDFTTWDKIIVPGLWEDQGYKNYDGIACYALEFELKDEFIGKRMVLVLGRIDDIDQVYLNGILIGQSGKFEKNTVQLMSNLYRQLRGYYLPLESLNSNGKNTLIIKVLDTGYQGGLYEGSVGLITQDNYIKYWNNRRKN